MICRPGEKETYNLAFGAIVFFQHLHIRVFGKAVFTDRGEVCGFPAGAIEILLDLGRHRGQSFLSCSFWTEEVDASGEVEIAASAKQSGTRVAGVFSTSRDSTEPLNQPQSHAITPIPSVAV